MPATKEDMLQEVGDYLASFLMQGRMPPFLGFLDPKLRIKDIDWLLRVHFLLSQPPGGEPSVAEFMSRLPERLRKMRTSVTSQPVSRESEIRGRVDWSATISERYRRNPSSRSLFVCRESEKDFEIFENLVLKELLLVVQSIVSDDLGRTAEHGYRWLESWTKPIDLRSLLNEVLAKNVYLRRIEGGNPHCTQEMIGKAIKSRNPLYREAGILLRRFRRITALDFDVQEAKEIIRGSFIVPEREAVLFELYCAVRIVRDLPDVLFYPITEGTNLIATWSSGGSMFRMYHDSCGSMSFRWYSVEDSRYLTDPECSFSRIIKAMEKYEELDPNSGERTGRPDIIVERYSEGRIESVLLAEVKYTEDIGYARSGLRELIEYMALVKSGDDFLDKAADLYTEESRVRGLLLTGRTAEMSVDEPSIQIIQFGDGQKIKWPDRLA